MSCEVSVTFAAFVFCLDKWPKDGGSTRVPVTAGGGGGGAF